MESLINGESYLARHKSFKLIGRDAELRRLSSVLMRSKANSVILVGPGGVGCTALCLGLQACKADPDTSFDIVRKQFYWLDGDTLFSSGDTARINTDFQRMLNVLNVTDGSVLIIEDTRDFIESCRNHGTMHFINALILAVRSEKTQVIFECRDDDLDVVLKAHSDMREAFTIVDVGEPSPDSLHMIVGAVSLSLEDFHRIKIGNDACAVATDLTNKYSTPALSRAQPERALTLLDRSLASYRLSAHAQMPAEGRQTMRELSRLHREAEGALLAISAEIENQRANDKTERESLGELTSFPGLAPDSQHVMGLIAKKNEASRVAAEYREEFDIFEAVVNKNLALTAEHVYQEFSAISGISAASLHEDEKEKLRNLESSLKKRIFGQDDAVKRVANAIKKARAKSKRDQTKPQAAFLLMGPSGVGKTETALALAEALYGSDAALTRFDMSEYMEKHAVAKLIGAPPGYELAEVGGILTNLMRKNGNRVLLFDEIEKAHPDVFNVFLQILSAGRLTDNVGRTVSFDNSIIIMTTNLGQPHFLRIDIDFAQAKALAMVDLEATYRSEFLNRFAGRHNIICFDKLGLDSINKIVNRELTKLSGAYEGITVFARGEDIADFCQDHYDPKVGARGLPGYIEAELEPAIADMSLSGYRGEVDIGYTAEKRLQIVAMDRPDREHVMQELADSAQSQGL